VNSFDVLVYVGLTVAAIAGFNAGLLRSAVTILGYLIAMPIAVWAMSLAAPRIGNNAVATLTQNSLLFFAVFLVAGIVLGKLLRMAVDDMIGPEAGIGDRLAGAALGAVRVGLVAVTLVLIFDSLSRSIASRVTLPARICVRCCRWSDRRGSSRCRRMSPSISTS
jgi:membrane protein required for colicin V production